MKKKGLIYCLVAVVIVLAIIAVVLAVVAGKKKGETGKENSVKELSNERINEINSTMTDKIQEFADGVNKNKAITQTNIDDLKKAIEDEIDLEVEVSMEAKVKKASDEKVELGSTDVAAGEVYEELDNKAILDAVKSEGKVKLNSSDIISVSVSLKDKRLTRGGEPYASYSTIIY